MNKQMLESFDRMEKKVLLKEDSSNPEVYNEFNKKFWKAIDEEGLDEIYHNILRDPQLKKEYFDFYSKNIPEDIITDVKLNEYVDKLIQFITSVKNKAKINNLNDNESNINSYVIIYSMNHYTKVNAKDEEEAKQLLLGKKKNAKISKIMPASEFKRGTQNMNENLIYESIDDTIDVDKAINFFKQLTIEKFAKMEPGTQTFDDVKFTIEPSGNDLIKWTVDIPKDKKYNHFSFALDLNKGSQIRQIFKDDVLDVIDALEDIKTQSAVDLKESKISIEDWDQNLILTRAFEIFRGDDDTVFNSQAMEKVGLLIDSQTIKLPKGTILNYESIGGYNTPAAIYSLPQYDNVEIKIYWDVWEEDLSKVVKAHLKESVTNYDKTIDRIKKIFANKDWSKVKKDIEKSDAGKKQIKDYFNKNSLTGYANLLDKVTIYLTGDPETIAHSDLKDSSITLNRELDIRSVADIVKHELDNLNKSGLEESYEDEKKFYPSKEVLDSIIDQVTTQGGSKEEAEIIAYALAQSSYEYGNGREYTVDLYENDITDTDDFLLNIDYYLRHDRDALELFKEYYSDALDLVENLNKKSSQLNQLKESLGTTRYNKIQKLIKECLAEGMEVEITIPKKRKTLTEAADTESLMDTLNRLSSGRKARNIIIPDADHNVYREVLHWIKNNGKSVKVLNADDAAEKSPSADVLLINDVDLENTRNAFEAYLQYDKAGKQIIYLVNTHEISPSIANKFAVARI